MNPSLDSPGTAGDLTSAGMEHTNTENAAPMAHNADTSEGMRQLDASKLIFIRNNNPKTLPNADEVANMDATTDHMITCTWNVKTGWHTPHLCPYGPLMLMPTASVLHYATECFEGTKCYRGYDGLLRLFRPDRNCVRMLGSAQRISLPSFDPKELLKLIEALVKKPSIGVNKPRDALLYIIALQFPILDEAKSNMKLLASRDDMVRAWPGGFGFATVGANYGPGFVAQAEAKHRGYDQVLWFLDQQNEVTEAGASNFFVVWKTKEGVLQLVTVPLTDGIILDGVTRRSVLDLARTRLDGSIGGLVALEVEERKFNMAEVEEAVEEGRMIETFVAGTAVGVPFPLPRSDERQLTMR
ncbi:MAG: hypothetical protein Q9188_000823 [Gyalolechia gomerana]